MANLSPPGGLTPLKYAGGKEYTGTCKPYYCSGGGLGIGDPVVKTAGSNSSAITVASGRTYGLDKYPIGSLKNVVKSTNGNSNATTGVVVQVALDATAGSNMSGVPALPSGTAGVVYVADEPDLLFVIQSNASGGVHTSADTGKNVNMTGSTYNTTTGQSVVQIDSSSVTDSATYQLTLEGVSLDLNQGDLTSANPSYYVRINNHTEVANIAGI
jgi:hypothetical protein